MKAMSRTAEERILREQVAYMLVDLNELPIDQRFQVVEHYFGLQGCRIAREMPEAILRNWEKYFQEERG
tara:strand:- start:143 stop:349 length:207 start_codon:yes stop_codon:yes gene_type:complete